MLLVAEEFKDVTESVQIPLHLTMDQPALNKTLDPLRRPKNVTRAIVVSVTIFCERRFIYILLQKVFEFHNFLFIASYCKYNNMLYNSSTELNVLSIKQKSLRLFRIRSVHYPSTHILTQVVPLLFSYTRRVF